MPGNPDLISVRVDKRKLEKLIDELHHYGLPKISKKALIEISLKEYTEKIKNLTEAKE